MTRKSLYAVILAVAGLAFVLGGMAVDPASAKGRRELHSVELLPVTLSGNVVRPCDDETGPGDCESDGFGTAAVARDNNFDVTSWGATLQNLLGYTDYYLSVGPDDDYWCAGGNILVVYNGSPMTTDKDGLASRNQLSDPSVQEGWYVRVCRPCVEADITADSTCELGEHVPILRGDLTTGGKENVHKNNAKNK